MSRSPSLSNYFSFDGSDSLNNSELNANSLQNNNEPQTLVTATQTHSEQSYNEHLQVPINFLNKAQAQMQGGGPGIGPGENQIENQYKPHLPQAQTETLNLALNYLISPSSSPSRPKDKRMNHSPNANVNANAEGNTIIDHQNSGLSLNQTNLSLHQTHYPDTQPNIHNYNNNHHNNKNNNNNSNKNNNHNHNLNYNNNNNNHHNNNNNNSNNNNNNIHNHNSNAIREDGFIDSFIYNSSFNDESLNPLLSSVIANESESSASPSGPFYKDPLISISSPIPHVRSSSNNPRISVSDSALKPGIYTNLYTKNFSNHQTTAAGNSNDNNNNYASFPLDPPLDPDHLDHLHNPLLVSSSGPMTGGSENHSNLNSPLSHHQANLTQYEHRTNHNYNHSYSNRFVYDHNHNLNNVEGEGLNDQIGVMEAPSEDSEELHRLNQNKDNLYKAQHQVIDSRIISSASRNNIHSNMNSNEFGKYQSENHDPINIMKENNKLLFQLSGSLKNNFFTSHSIPVKTSQSIQQLTNTLNNHPNNNTNNTNNNNSNNNTASTSLHGTNKDESNLNNQDSNSEINNNDNSKNSYSENNSMRFNVNTSSSNSNTPSTFVCSPSGSSVESSPLGPYRMDLKNLTISNDPGSFSLIQSSSPQEYNNNFSFVNTRTVNDGNNSIIPPQSISSSSGRILMNINSLNNYHISPPHRNNKNDLNNSNNSNTIGVGLVPSMGSIYTKNQNPGYYNNSPILHSFHSASAPSSPSSKRKTYNPLYPFNPKNNSNPSINSHVLKMSPQEISARLLSSHLPATGSATGTPSGIGPFQASLILQNHSISNRNNSTPLPMGLAGSTLNSIQTSPILSPSNLSTVLNSPQGSSKYANLPPTVPSNNPSSILQPRVNPSVSLLVSGSPTYTGINPGDTSVYDIDALSSDFRHKRARTVNEISMARIKSNSKARNVNVTESIPLRSLSASPPAFLSHDVIQAIPNPPSTPATPNLTSLNNTKSSSVPLTSQEKHRLVDARRRHKEMDALSKLESIIRILQADRDPSTQKHSYPKAQLLELANLHLENMMNEVVQLKLKVNELNGVNLLTNPSQVSFPSSNQNNHLNNSNILSPSDKDNHQLYNNNIVAHMDNNRLSNSSELNEWNMLHSNFFHESPTLSIMIAREKGHLFWIKDINMPFTRFLNISRNLIIDDVINPQVFGFGPEFTFQTYDHFSSKTNTNIHHNYSKNDDNEANKNENDANSNDRKNNNKDVDDWKKFKGVLGGGQVEIIGCEENETNVQLAVKSQLGSASIKCRFLVHGDNNEIKKKWNAEDPLLSINQSKQSHSSDSVNPSNNYEAPPPSATGPEAQVNKYECVGDVEFVLEDESINGSEQSARFPIFDSIISTNRDSLKVNTSTKTEGQVVSIQCKKLKWARIRFESTNFKYVN